MKFQFHKGTIKTNSLHYDAESKRNFNSIKVRLKLGGLLSAAGNLVFQFHKGTIKTPKTDSRVSRFIGFQFHKGTIKTICNLLLF